MILKLLLEIFSIIFHCTTQMFFHFRDPDPFPPSSGNKPPESVKYLIKNQMQAGVCVWCFHSKWKFMMSFNDSKLIKKNKIRLNSLNYIVYYLNLSCRNFENPDLCTRGLLVSSQKHYLP